MVEESFVFAFLAENQLTWQLGLNVSSGSNHSVIITAIYSDEPHQYR